MSQENVEIARRGFEAFNRRDAVAMQALCTPDLEFVPLRAALEGTAYRGPDAIAQAQAAFDESWENLRFEVEEARDADKCVIVIARLCGVGRATGAEVDARLSMVLRFRDGKISSIRTYTDHREALEAAGLSE